MKIDPNYKYVKALPTRENTEALKSNVLRNRLLAVGNALVAAVIAGIVVWWLVLLWLHFS